MWEGAGGGEGWGGRTGLQSIVLRLELGVLAEVKVDVCLLAHGHVLVEHLEHVEIGRLPPPRQCARRRIGRGELCIS